MKVLQRNINHEDMYGGLKLIRRSPASGRRKKQGVWTDSFVRRWVLSCHGAAWSYFSFQPSELVMLL